MKVEKKQTDTMRFTEFMEHYDLTLVINERGRDLVVVYIKEYDLPRYQAKTIEGALNNLIKHIQADEMMVETLGRHKKIHVPFLVLDYPLV